MLVGSLFSGIGGFELGTLSVFTQAEIVWQIEIDSYCQSILHKRFPHSQKYRDITQVQGDTLQDIELLLCGFPCQDLSIANNTRQTGNINGKKSGLWWEAHRIIKDKRPKYIMLENVSAITFRDKGGMAVLQSLAALGYDAWWDCIQAQEMGAPHIRERWFCICIRQADTTDTDMCSIKEHTSEAKNTPCGPAQWNRNSSLNVQAAKMMGYTLQTIGKDRRLSPRFVEWMMGFPKGWLE